MKILMMVCAFPPAPCGGAEKQCLAQALALAARGHEVTVLTEWLNRRHPREEIRDGIRILRRGFLLPLHSAALRLEQALSRGRPQIRKGKAGGEGWAPAWERPIPWWRLAPQMAREWSFIAEVAWELRHRRWKVDVVHVHESGWIAGFAHWAAEQLHAPVICKEACGEVLRWPERKDVPWLSRWERRRKECAFIAITSHVRRELEKAGIRSDRIYDVPNGIAVPSVFARPQESGLAVYAGNFSQGAGFKGFDVLIRALGLACRMEPGMRLHLYGGGDAGGWKKLAQEEGLGSEIEFRGVVPDLIPVFAGAGFLVLPSRVEGLSNVLLEAQSVGLPAIVSDIPGNRRVVTHGVNGWVVPVGDAQALAEAMVNLYRAPDLRAEMGRRAQEAMARDFAMPTVAEQLEKVFQDLLRPVPESNEGRA